MDKIPKFNFIRIFFSSKIILLSLLIVFCISCTNTEPSISFVDAKIIYNFEDNQNLPDQKLNLFLKMSSDVHRVDSLSLYNIETGYRWHITTPLISQADGSYYVGYTNIRGTSQNENLIPYGKYNVYFLDAQGRQEFAVFELEQTKSYEKMKLEELLEELKNENLTFYVAVYSENSTLLYYGAPLNEWNVSLDFDKINSKEIFLKYKDSNTIRVFIQSGINYFIMPKILQNQNSFPEKKSSLN